MIKLLLLLSLTLTHINSFIITTPQPVLNYDYDLLQIGTQTLSQSNNIGPAPLFHAYYTKIFTKMNQNLPNTYSAYLGWRGAHIYYHKQSQNAVTYQIAIVQKNAADIKIYVSSDFSAAIVFIGVNYLLIHQSLVTTQFMFGAQFYISTDCSATTPGMTVCDNPVPFIMPATGWTPLVFINYVRFYRAQLYTSYDLHLYFSVQIIDASNINIKIQFGIIGLLEQCAVSVVVYKDTLTNPSVNKVLMLTPFQNTTPQTTSITYTPMSINLLPVKIYQSNVFFGLSKMKSRSMEFHYDIFPDTVSFTLIGSIYFPVSVAYFKGFAVSGYTCTDPHYFNEFSQQCDMCPLNCKSCVADVLGVVMCLQCYDNYFISAGKLSCDCTMDAIASICQTLIFPVQIGCVNAQRFNGDAKCLFCSPAQYKILSTDNKCLCTNGYNDNNSDGICQQTCGDGLIFSAQCDDGNILQNDGCSQSCVLQEGFTCDKSQPSYCQSLSMIRYKFGQVKKIQFYNQAEITLFIKNPKQTLPFLILKEHFQPQSTHIKLFFTSNQYPFEEIQIQDLKLIEIDGNYMIKFTFQFQFTLQSYNGRIVLDYEKTRYLQDKQQIRFQTEGIDKPLIYSSNLQSFKIIGYVNLVIIGLNFIAILISLLSPKFIGLETILTLQLIFYSQLLIDNPSKWPIGFSCFKYLKFASGFNKIFNFTDYHTLSVNTKKFFHLQMQKTLIQNFNLNFLLLLLTFIAFIVLYLIKYKKQSEFQKHQFNRKYLKKGEYQPVNEKQLLKSIDLWKKLSDKVFWVVNCFAFWFILPLIASMSTQILIENTLVTVNAKTFVQNLLIDLGSMVGSVSLLIIFIICLNNFKNLWLSRQSMKKISYKPEEMNYKRTLFIYLLIIGMMILFFNKTQLLGFPFSVFVLIFQILYTIIILVINPYQQSLRIHTVTLVFNQVIYIAFLILVNLVNLFNDLKQILILISSYSIAFFCIVSVVLTGIRLYYELKFGEALEKQIQRERQKQDQAGQLRKQQLYKKKMRKLKNFALDQQSDTQKHRAKNRFLFQNQIEEDKAKGTIQWLDQTKWQPEDKQKYFIQKSSFQPLEWLQVHDKDEFQKQIIQKEELQKQRNERKEKIKNDQNYKMIAQKLKQEVNRNVSSWNKKIEGHEKRIRKDINYVMDMKKDDINRYMKLEYTIKK